MTGFIFDWDMFRRDVRTDIRNCALYMFFYFAVFTALSFAAAYVLNHFWGSPDPGLISIICVVVGSLIFLIPRKKRFYTDIALPATERMTPKIFIVLVVTAQGLRFAFAIVIALVDSLLPEGQSLTENYSTAIEGFASPLSFLYIIIVGPIFEELVFRGAIMGSLRKYGDNFAILLSSLFFGFFHAVLFQIPFAFLVGLLLGYAAARWSLRASIALHIVINGLSALFLDNNSIRFMLGGALVIIACAIASFVFLIVWNETLRLRIQGGAAFYARTYANGFSSVALWLFLIAMTIAGIDRINGFVSGFFTGIFL